MNIVDSSDIFKGFEKLGIIGERVVIHSSLQSLGYVKGGAETVIDVILDSFKTILMPAFCWSSNTAPPEDDRPVQNGCDYSFYDGWEKKSEPFIVESAGVERRMGIISRKFVSLPYIYRSDHAWHSWAAYGDLAGRIVENHTWDTTNLPIERLSDLGGHILLLGVGLSSCTAIHIAEEKAGRHPFIRWATDRNGVVRRVRAAGCAKGFDNLMPYCKDLFRESYIGNCRIITTPLQPFIDHVTSIIKSFPEETRCSETCIRCTDAILGGPID